MFVCGKGALQNGKRRRTITKTAQLRNELRKLKRNDIIHVLDEQGKVKAIRRILELHGRQYLQLRINRADATSDNMLTFKICLSVSEDIRKLQRLIVAGCQFAEEIILFHSLDKHFEVIQRLVNDVTGSKKVVRYEPLGHYFEVSKEISTHHVENLAASLHQQLTDDPHYQLELLKLTGCQIKETHIYAMQNITNYVQRLDLTGNDTLPSKAIHILSNILLHNNKYLKSLNLSSCNITDNHMIDLQPALYLIGELDLSYNEELTPIAMKVITSSMHIADLTRKSMAGLDLTKTEIKNRSNAGLTDSDGKSDVDGREATQASDQDSNGAEQSENNKSTLRQDSNSLILQQQQQQQQQHSLWKLVLAGCHLQDQHIQQLYNTIYRLKYLDLSGNTSLTPGAMRVIADAILDNLGADRSSIIENENPTEHSIENKSTNGSDSNGECSSQNVFELLPANAGNNLETLRLENCNLTTEHMEMLSPCITYLRKLDLSWNLLSQDCIQVIGDRLIYQISEDRKVFHLKTLNLTGCELTDDHMNEIIHSIKYLQTLNLGYNKRISTKSLQMISEQLNTAKIPLLKDTEMAVEGYSQTQQQQQQQQQQQSKQEHHDGSLPCLEMLDLSGINIDEQNLEEFLFICTSASLQTLELSSTNLTDSHITRTQLSFPLLYQLHLADNSNLTPYATKIISDVITTRVDNNEVMNLKVLNLRKCKLLETHIANLIPCIKYLQTLDISYNPLLTPKAIQLIASNLDQGLPSSKFDAATATSDDHLQINCLQELNLASCGFKDKHIVNLSGAFTKLYKLDIRANDLTYITLLAIRNDVLEAVGNDDVIMNLQELNVYQAFGFRDYHYRQFENDLKPCGVKVISVV